jgi:cell division protein FtsZ
MVALGPEATLLSAYAAANDVLKNAVQGISELITLPGLVNVDFADVRTVMGEMGKAMMGSGSASGENRSIEATQLAISSPLLEDVNLKGARGILVNVISGMDITLGEVNAIGEIVKEIASDDAQIVFGSVFDMSLQDEVRVTIVATGLDQPVQQAAPQAQQRPQIEVVKRKASGEVDYAGLDTPTAIRRNKIAVGDDAAPTAVDEEYLDIPAFLRRQAD